MSYAFSPTASGFPSSSLARHDTDYHITVRVTNHAFLSSSLTQQFTVDTTTPLTGAVFDAPSGMPDIDYQTSPSLSAWWSGFFDRETDIAFYQYAFGTRCVNASTFSYPLAPDSQAVQRNTLSTTWTAPGVGTYYVSVVAYNNAFRPSAVVCSDGITVDVTEPYFEGVSIPRAVITPGLARSTDGVVWLIGPNRERRLVRENEGCTSQSSLISAQELSKYPVSSVTEVVEPTLCAQYEPFSPSVTYLTSDHVLNVSWSAGDDSGVHDYQIGITSAGNYSQDPASITYTSTAGHSHYSVYNPAILSNGNRFYLSIMARDFAGLVTRLDIGPVVVDIVPPLVNGSLTVERYGDSVALSWSEGTFSDPEDVDGALSYEYAAGKGISIGTGELSEVIIILIQTAVVCDGSMELDERQAFRAVPH